MAVPLTPFAKVAAGIAIDKGADVASSLISRAGKTALAGTGIKSLADVSQPARVEPLALIERELRDQPYMTDIMQTVLTMFTGYYMQAVSLILNVNRVETLRVLDSINPTRGGVFAGARGQIADAVFSRESYEGGLPSLETLSPELPERVVVSIEQRPTQSPETNRRSGSVSVDSDSVRHLYEATNLAVGKMVNVEFKDDNSTVKIPVTVRLVPTVVDPETLTHIFTATAKTTTWKDRWHLWRAGQIRFVRDLMFSMDIVEAHRKTLINDTSNVYMAITDRRRNNTAKAYATGQPSMADASNIAVISKETAVRLGRELGGKLDSLRTRKRIFDASYLILMVVVDEAWERVTIYHRGLDQSSELSFKEIQQAERGKGPDITDILKAYSLGSTPTI